MEARLRRRSGSAHAATTIALCGLGIALFTLATSACSTRAYSAWDGDRLLAVCSGAGAGQQTSDCEVFIRGAVDRYHELLATQCAPKQVRFSEIVGIVVRYLQTHPAERPLPANELVLASVREAFCRPERG